MTNGPSRYSELKPTDVEGNLFSYHLKQLMREKLVEKTDEKYQFTQTGLLFINRYSLDLGKIRLQPKTLNAVIAFKNDKILVHQRKVEPFSGLITLINGKLHFGETLLDSARRELKEKTNAEAEKLTHRSSTYLSYFNDDICFNHVLSHNFVVSSFETQPTSTKHNEVLWLTRNELATTQNTMNGTLEIIDDLLNNTEFTFKEYRLNGERKD